MNRLFKINVAVNGFGLIAGLFLASQQPLWGGILIGAGAVGLNETISRAYKAGKLSLMKSTEAVSPVIGVILMVAITVVLAAVVFVLVMNLSHTGPQSPHMAFNSDDHGNFTVVSADLNVPWSDLLLGPGTSCMPTGTAHQYVLAGDVIHCTADHLTVVHRPSNAVIYSK